MTRVPDPSLTPAAAVERLADMSAEVRAAVLLDEGHQVTACRGVNDEGDEDQLGRLACELLAAADGAGTRAGLNEVAGIEVSRPEGGVYGVRDADRAGRRWTLVAITAGGALPSLMLFDLRMTVAAIGEGS